MVPETRYTQTGDVAIAYQTVGEGQRDLLTVPGFVSHLEEAWEDPSYARFLRQLSSFSRLICFDKRGTGLSDRRQGIPTLEQRMDDVRAVMDAVGLHTGEVELVGDDVAGIAVHIAARVLDMANPNKGIEGEWALFSVQ
jgi:pimeloyl-ACP methyl ester carboxylesterase